MDGLIMLGWSRHTAVDENLPSLYLEHGFWGVSATILYDLVSSGEEFLNKLQRFNIFLRGIPAQANPSSYVR